MIKISNNHLEKSFLSIKYLTFALLCLCIGQLSALTSAGLGKCKVYANGNTVAVWEAIDDNFNTIIQGAVGNVSTPASEWSVTTLSEGISPTFNNSPALFSNSIGDVVVLWECADENGNFWVAASVLQHGTTTWLSQIISDETESAQFLDQVANVDAEGNVLAIWSSTDINSGITQLRGATTVVGSTWNNPQLIAP